MRSSLIPFNSALLPLDEVRSGLAEVDYFANSRGAVFCHDLTSPMPPARLALIRRVDCVYSEMPWPHGWPIFYERTGSAPQSTYSAYLDAVERLIADLAKPTFLICPKVFARRFGEPRLVTLRGSRTWLAATAPVPAEIATTDDLLPWLARQYRAVYDFSCGFGSGLRPFRYAVGSDIDRKCLAYVAREVLNPL